MTYVKINPVYRCCAKCKWMYDVAKDGPQCPACGAIGYSKEFTQGHIQEEVLEDADPSAIYDEVHLVKHYQVFPEKEIEARHIIARCIELSELEGEAAYHYGNSLKYLLRLNRKGSLKRDASKCQQYLDYLKESHEDD